MRGVRIPEHPSTMPSGDWQRVFEYLLLIMHTSLTLRLRLATESLSIPDTDACTGKGGRIGCDWGL